MECCELNNRIEDNSQVEMTYDNVNSSKLDKFANNNNVVYNLKQNGQKLNGNCLQINGTSKKKSEVRIIDEDELETRKSLIILAIIFISGLLALFYIYKNFPRLDESERANLKIPLNIEDAKQLGRVLDRYKESYYFEVMMGICLLYLFLQTFAIPGSLFLSILLGFLFKFPIALLLICTCSAIGATLCYLLSLLLGRRLVKYYFPKRAEQWSHQVQKHKDDMLSYILFLRMTPLLPNWFINLVAPVIGVPLFPFVFGTFAGVMPPSFLAIEAGKTLYKMTSSSIAFSWTSITMLFVFSMLALAPVFLKKYFKSKID
ncbi:hypothetical protein PVAND_011917 [Polypedilum vanderplanki]|uniref:VTT domain-containing protein n=1 Tax=Polypedilum vanderplanki TaxID=319348 RepID=A0A9J6CKR5_POLVA|nr:hypothetical protein PVAND_011917 [Polypedilum vanderplanki]